MRYKQEDIIVQTKYVFEKDLEELYVKDAKIRTFRVARSAHSYFFLEISYTYVYSSDQNEIMSVATHKDNHSVKIYD